jgi:PAS domain S-box-containing protein
MPGQSGWARLFWSAFSRSRNPMVVLDDHRRFVNVNNAFLELVGRRRRDLVGHPTLELLPHGSAFTDAQWRRNVAGGDFTGAAELSCADGDTVNVQWAAHPEVVTGHELVLLVALSTSRWGRHFRRAAPNGARGDLSPRELEVVRLIADGDTGREIAEQLHLSHDTVRTHVRNAMAKVGARSRAQLVAKVLAEGVLDR